VNTRLKRAKVGETARTSMILVNQTRPEIGGNMFAPEAGHSSGGQGRKFFAGQRVVFTPSTPDKEVRGSGDNTHTTRFGKKIHTQVIKNKCGGPEETGHFMFFNRPKPKDDIVVGVDDAEAIISYGMLYEVLKPKGNFVYHGKKALGNCKAKAMKFLRTADPQYLVELKEEIMQAAKNDFTGEASVKPVAKKKKLKFAKRK